MHQLDGNGACQCEQQGRPGRAAAATVVAPAPPFQGREGNAAAEAAGGPPCLALTVHVPAAGGEARLEVQSKTQGWEAKLAGAEAGNALQVNTKGQVVARCVLMGLGGARQDAFHLLAAYGSLNGAISLTRS